MTTWMKCWRMCLVKYRIVITKKFSSDLKLIKKRGYDISLFREVVLLLSEGKPLPERNRDHKLSGRLMGYRECHITPDWLLIYRICEEDLILFLSRTGTHSDLF